MDLNKILDPGELEPGQVYAVSWHDVTCLHGQNCPSRLTHALQSEEWVSGLLTDYERRTLDLTRKIVKRKMAEEEAKKSE